MPKIGVRALNALLFALCCFEAAEIVTSVTSHGLQEGTVAPAPGADAAAAPAPAPADDGSSIVARNLFGAQLGNESLAPAPEEDVEETKLPLTLLATIAPDATAGTDGPKVARAAIYDGSSKESLVVVPGDALGNHQDVFVSRIERGRVLLRNQGRNEELLLAEETDVPSGAGPAPGPGRNFSRRPTRPRPPARPVRARNMNRAVNRAFTRPRVAPRPVVRPPPTPPEIDPEKAARLDELRQKVQDGEMSIDDLAGQLQQMQNPDDGGADDGDTAGQPEETVPPDDQSEY